jgi:hypothetical protein
MAKQVQLRRGTTAELSSVTGAAGEVIVDTTKDTLTVHDAYTAGGTPLLREDLGNLANNSIGLGKIATGTQGQVLYYNASGQLTTLNPGTAGQFLTTSGSGANPSWTSLTPPGVLYTHFFEDATRNISISTSSSGTPISFQFTKQYASSYLVLKGWTPVMGQASYNSGEYVQIESTRKYQATAYFSVPGGMSDASDGITGICNWQGYWTDITTTGVKTVTLGWQSRGGSNEQPGIIWNPDQRSARMQSRTTNIVIYEVDSTKFSLIT